MKSTFKWVAVAVGAATLLGAGAVGASAVVFEHDGPGAAKKAHRFISMKVDNMLDDVAANDTQRRQINDIKEQMFEEGLSLKEGMQGAKGELKAQWLAPQVDRTRVHQLVDQRIDAFRAFAHKAADALIQAHDVFTPQQREQLQKMHDERMKSGPRW